MVYLRLSNGNKAFVTESVKQIIEQLEFLGDVFNTDVELERVNDFNRNILIINFKIPIRNDMFERYQVSVDEETTLTEIEKINLLLYVVRTLHTKIITFKENEFNNSIVTSVEKLS